MKRATEEVAPGDDPNKRPRTDGAGKPSLSLDALEKAKKALQLQKELKEKLKKLPQLQKPLGAAAPAPAGPPSTDVGSKVVSATAKAAEIAARFGVPVTPAPSAAALAQPLAAPSPSVGVGSAGVAHKPAPLRLDAMGRELDAFGNVISRPVQPVTTLRVNQLAAQGGTASVMPRGGTASRMPPPPGPSPDAFFDERMGARGLKKLERRPKPAFEFVQQGEFQRQAELFRLRARYGEGAGTRKGAPQGPIGPAPLGKGMDPNQIPLGANPNLMPLGTKSVSREGTPGTAGFGAHGEEEEEEEELPEVVPDVEWWDKGLLATGSYEEDIKPLAASQPPTACSSHLPAKAEGQGSGEAMQEDGKEAIQEDSKAQQAQQGDGAGGVQVAIKEAKITHFVEHPIPVEPPAELPVPPPQPLKLTKRELKKLRTQRRQAREAEKQDLIRQGLLEPAKPKVKLSNLYRVLGEQAVADPTLLELETKKQMAERQSAHEDRNIARMLTPAERRMKKQRKMFDDNGVDLIAAVYRVERLDNPQNCYKVDINAKENHMTGVLLMTPEFSLVVVEGCGKAHKRYAKLMLRRIDWSLPAPKQGKGAAMDEEDEDEDEGPSNACNLVWEGLVKKPAFQGFKVEQCQSVEHAQQVLSMRSVCHYWDAAKNFNPNEARPVEL